MASRRSSPSTIGSFETLEPRALLSGTTTIPVDDTAAEVRSVLEQQMRPRVLYAGAQDTEQFWGTGSPGIGAINDARQLVSARELVPTPEQPLTIELQFSIQGRSGIVIATRTEGPGNQEYQKEYQRGLVFTVEYNGMSGYQYDPAGGAYVMPYVQFSNLQDGATYTLTIEDKGTQAHVRLEHEGAVILDQTAQVSRQTGLGGIVIRKQNPSPTLRLHVPSLSVTHGSEPVSQAPREESPDEVPPRMGPEQLDTASVDAVMSDLMTLLREWEEEQIPDIEQKPSPVLYSSADKQAFWDGVEPGQETDLNTRTRLQSKNEVIPTAEDPLSINMQFSIQGKAGVVIATRTEGAANDKAEKEYDRGLVFTVEYNGMSVYQYDPAGGAYVMRYVQFPALESGATYDLTIEDTGTQAHVRLEQGGSVILDQTGAVNRQTGLGGIVVRKQDPNPDLRVGVSSLTIAHGKDAMRDSAELAAAPTSTTSASSTVERGDARLALISSMEYGNPAVTGAGRADIFQQSRFFGEIDKKMFLARHPSYGGENSGVNRDLENELEHLLSIYTDVVGDMLTRGMEVRLAELKGEPIQKPLEMMHWIVANRWKPERRVQYFGVHLPSVNQVLDESARLFNGNLDRMIDYQEAMRQQEWEDTHLGDTPRATSVESRALELNMSRGLRDAMINTAMVIGNYSSDVRREFETAVIHAGLNVQEVYAEAGVTAVAVTQMDETQLQASLPPTANVLGTISTVRPLDIQDGKNIGTESINLPAEGSETLRFTLDREVMANFWVNSVPGRAVSLTIAGSGFSYSSDHGLSSASSTSLKLTPGTYDVTVTDKTNYGVMPNGNDLKSRSLEFPLNIDVREWNTREIMGRVSLPGESEAKEVSLRVAEFDENGTRKKDYLSVNGKDSISKLDPTKPIWVVAHGREDNENSGKMEMLAKELKASGYQVLTADWSGARDNFPHNAGMQGEQWIEPSAQKFYEMLNSLGIRGENISFGVHSWASLLAFEVAERYSQNNDFGVQAIVALDPAKDPTLSLGYDASQVDFGKVSNVSWGFHSSMWGSVPRTLTGGRATQIRSPGVWNITDEHGLAVTAFANLVRLQRQDPNNELASEFSLKSLESKQRVPCDEFFDGWMWVDSAKKIDENGDPYIDAIPMKFTDTDPDDSTPDVYRNAFFSNSVQ